MQPFKLSFDSKHSIKWLVKIFGIIQKILEMGILYICGIPETMCLQYKNCTKKNYVKVGLRFTLEENTLKK